MTKEYTFIKLNEESVEHARLNKPDKHFVTGKILPDRIKKKVPPKLFGVPIEEMDDYYKNHHVSLIINFKLK